MQQEITLPQLCRTIGFTSLNDAASRMRLDTQTVRKRFHRSDVDRQELIIELKRIFTLESPHRKDDDVSLSDFCKWYGFNSVIDAAIRLSISPITLRKRFHSRKLLNEVLIPAIKYYWISSNIPKPVKAFDPNARFKHPRPFR